VSDYLEDLALYAVTCSFCGARPGHWCVTARPTTRAPGRRTPYLHQARTALILEAWRAGVASGRRMAYGEVAHAIEGRLAGAWWARETPTDPEGIARYLRGLADAAR